MELLIQRPEQQNLLQDERFNHQVEVEHGVLEEECQQILKDFFKGLRERNKRRKEQKRLENGE